MERGSNYCFMLHRNVVFANYLLDKTVERKSACLQRLRTIISQLVKSSPPLLAHLIDARYIGRKWFALLVLERHNGLNK